MSEYKVYACYSKFREHKMTTNDLKDTLYSCAKYDSLCQDGGILIVTKNDKGFCKINQHGPVRFDVNMSMDKAKIVEDFVKQLKEGKINAKRPKRKA